MISLILAAAILAADPPAPEVPTDALATLNARRLAAGLKPYQADAELAELARRRLAHNVRRGRWGHYLRRGRPHFTDLDGLVIGYGPACCEGVGTSTSADRFNTCYALARTRDATPAGAAGVRMADGRHWWLLLVRRRR